MAEQHANQYSRKPSTKGAIKLAREAREPRKWGRYLLGATALLSVLWLAKDIPFAAAYEKVVDMSRRPLQQIVVEGSFQYVSKERLQQLIVQKLSDDFVKADLQKIQRQLKAHPWIYRVSLSRVWPDILRVNVIEQQPIARWSDSGFINIYGEFIAVDDLAAIAHLPLLSGEAESSDEVAKQYRDIVQKIAPAQLHVKAFRVDATGAKTLELDNGLTLILGNRQLMDRLDNFLLVYQQQLARDVARIEQVDMRYESGMAVSWRHGSEQVLLGLSDQ